MSQQYFGKEYQGKIPENYERYFVPAIGAPLANDLIETAALNQGERVLDVACGTGLVARLAAEQVGVLGSVAGLDVNPGMLAAARATAPPNTEIDWREASAESMPFPEAAFDAVLCQMGLQFVPDRPAALREMLRVLTPGGRLVLNVPGPTPPPFEILGEALTREIGPQAAGFVHQIFSLYDKGELQGLVSQAGFGEVSVRADSKSLRLPEPREFLWQFMHSTPLATAAAGASDESLGALERDVTAKWGEFTTDHSLMVRVRMVTASGRKA